MEAIKKFKKNWLFFIAMVLFSIVLLAFPMQMLAVASSSGIYQPTSGQNFRPGDQMEVCFYFEDLAGTLYYMQYSLSDSSGNYFNLGTYPTNGRGGIQYHTLLLPQNLALGVCTLSIRILGSDMWLVALRNVSIIIVAPAPTVVTKPITTPEITFNGELTGGAPVTDHGFYLGTSSTSIKIKISLGPKSGLGPFSSSGQFTFSPGTTYYYRAYATNSGGVAYGSILFFTTPVSPSLFLKVNSPTSITISWNSISGTAFYELSRSTSSSGPFTIIYTGPSISYTESGLNPGTTYYYRARAYNGAYSDYSPIRSATTFSDDADLSGLSLSTGMLNPAFSPKQTGYTVSVPYETEEITISATTSHPKAVINGAGLISLGVGPNTIAIVVTAEDDITKETYTIVVTRDFSPDPIYKWEATGDIGTVGRVVYDISDDPDFLEKYALACDEDIEVEIYYSPIRTENAIAAGKNIYVFAVRLPNGETREDISFSFKPIGGDVEKNKVIIYGDVNADGNVTTTDATLITRWAGGNIGTPLQNILAADVNGDACITTTDATLITRRAGGNPSVTFTIETQF
jgi:hypothetical protein